MLAPSWKRGLGALAWLACASSPVVPSLAHALDFDTVAREVAAANPRLAAGQSMAQAARHRVAPAGAWPSPMVELGAENVPTTGGFDQDPMTMKVIGLTQRVPVFGRANLAQRSARAAFTAETLAVRAARFELIGQALENYSDAYYAGALANHAIEHQSTLQRMVQAARTRYESGQGRLEDVLRADAERGRTRADVAAFRAEENAARARLDALRGRSPGAAAPDTLAPPPFRAWADGDAWRAAISPDHPRLLEGRARVERYEWAASSARRSIWPDLELRGAYEKREDLFGTVPQHNMWSASVGFTVPIFATGNEVEQNSEMKAMARASEAELGAQLLDLEQQVAAAYAEADGARRMVALLADTVLTTQNRAVEASWISYTAGAADLWRVLEATHTLYGDEVALGRARRDLARAIARLVSITGRADLAGFTLPADQGGER